MYIYDGLTSRRSRRCDGSPLFYTPAVCSCGGHAAGLAEAPVRRVVSAGEVPLPPTTSATKGIARRVRDAVVKMSMSYDATLQNTARQVVDARVPLRFIGDLKAVADPEGVLRSWGMSPEQIASTRQTHTLVEIPGSDPALIPKKGKIRAFERNGVVYIPSDSSEPNLTTDIIHEVNHALNPVRATDRAGMLWEKVTAEARASWVADHRAETRLSNKSGIPLRLEKAIDDAKQTAVFEKWTTWSDWPAIEARLRTWTPDGNLDNR